MLVILVRSQTSNPNKKKKKHFLTVVATNCLLLAGLGIVVRLGIIKEKKAV